MRVLVLALIALIAGCANAADQPSDLVISDSTVTLAMGRMKDVSAMGGPAGEGLVWTSDHPEVATVTSGADGNATITAVAVGHAMVSASTGQLAVGTDVTVTAAELDTIDIVAAHDSIARGLTLQLMAEGTYSDKTTKDVTADVTWSASMPAIASVDAGGMLTAVAAGTETIGCTLGSVAAMTTLTVTDAAIASIDLSPTPLPTTLPKGATRQVVATGRFTDLSTMEITDEVAWTSSAPDVVAVSHTGLLTGMGVTGSATITATAAAGTADEVTAMFDVTAAPAALTVVAIAPAGTPLMVPLGKTTALTAQGTYTDGTMADVTATAQWTVVSGAAVTVSPAGSMKAVAQGAATVKAAIGAVSATLDVAVEPAAVDHLALSTGDVSMMKGQRAKVKATLVYSDATVVDVTASATWTVTAGTSVAVSSPGVVDASATVTGASTVKATASGQSATFVATVRAVACHPVINEVQAQGTSAGDEWVEVYNPCTTTFDLSGWTLVYRAAGTTGATDTNTLQPGLGTMNAGDYHLYVGAGYAGTATPDAVAWSSGIGLAGANGAIGLRNGPISTGTLVDAVAYGAVTAGHPFIEGAAAPALANGKSIGRGPIDGADSDANNVDFTLRAAPTPRAANN